MSSYSEFGLIIANLGVNNGWLSEEWLVLLAVTVALSFTVSAPLNRYAHQLYTRAERLLKRFESTRRHPDDEPISLGNSHVMIMGMGRVGAGAYDELIGQGQRVVGLDSDPAKVERHLKDGRRVLYADAEDPGFWSNLNLGGVDAVLFAVPDPYAKLMGTRQLRTANYAGQISATVVHPEEEAPLREAGADVIYNYYDGVGAGLARLSLERRDSAPLGVAGGRTQ